MAKTKHQYENKRTVSAWRMILPTLFAWITNERRYIPELEWSGSSVIFNLFRAYEQTFGRRFGVRPEASTNAIHHEDGTLVVEHYFHTVEAALVHMEGLLRNAFVWKPFRIYVPMLVTPQGFMLPASPFLFAVAYDTSSSGNASTASTTFNHTATGSDLTMVALIYATAITGATYNSVSLTGSVNSSSLKLWYLKSPATGLHSFSATNGSGSNKIATVSTFSGTNTTGGLDATGTGSQGATGSQGVTSTVDNCYHFGSVYNTSQQSFNIQDTCPNATYTNNSVFGTIFMRTGYGGPIHPAGSDSWSFQSSNSGQTNNTVDCSIAPVPSTNWTQTLTETVSHTDTLIKSPAKFFSEALSMVLTFMQTTSRNFTETVSHTATLTALRIVPVTLSDVVNFTDTILTIISAKILTETTNLTDTLVKLPNRIFTEVTSLTDSLVRSVTRVLSEALAMVDTLAKATTRDFTETITHTATFIGIRNLIREYTETTTITATLLKGAGRTLSEVVSFSEYLIVKINGVVTNGWSKVARSIDEWTKQPNNLD